jgi:hypothetical protein
MRPTKAFLRRLTLALAALAFLSFLLPPPSMAKEASDRDREQMSIEIANYIHDPYGVESHPNAFGGGHRIAVGAAIVQGTYALADWRSADGKHWGQVAFFYMCDNWNIGPITNTRRMSVRELSAMTRSAHDKAVPAKLIAELTVLENRRIALMPPSRPMRGC